MSNKDTQALIDNPELDEQAAVQDHLTAQTDSDRETIELDEPIQRGKTTITELQIRKPKAGELRGVSLMELAQMDVMALRKVLPRITTPTLTDIEIGNMDPADILQCGVAVAGFLVTKKQKAQSGYLDA